MDAFSLVVSDFLGPTVNECLFCTQGGETMSSRLVGQPHVRSLRLWCQQRLQPWLQQDYWRVSLQGMKMRFSFYKIYPNWSEPSVWTLCLQNFIKRPLTIVTLSHRTTTIDRKTATPVSPVTAFIWAPIHAPATQRRVSVPARRVWLDASATAATTPSLKWPARAVRVRTLTEFPTLSLKQRCGKVHLH